MSDNSASSLFFSAAVNHLSPSIQDSIIDSLIAAEPHHSPHPDYLLRCQRRSVNLTHRQDSINWILNAHSHHRFQPITAILSVNYLDRFLSSSAASLLGNNGWAFQLLSVACLSLAAKMEEPDVPLLLDLQVLESPFIFEPKSVQRMELLVMEKLNWRLRSVTPFDFIYYFIFKLPPSSRTNELHFHSKCSDLIIKTIRVIDFLGFQPSVIAAAAVISAAGEGVDVPESYYEKVNKEMVRSCHQLMEEYLVDTCPSAVHKVRKQWRPDQPPPSPDGVLDAAATCVSCDTRSDNLLFVPTTPSGDDDREAKRLRFSVQEEQP
ncbi:cyclin-D1-1 [Lactuca sativa]|uniref:cyclin-D1-1 n=1 Tax=Lactuca sativa TaxID=4236 RepID=UPI000CD8216D|nr:cyclin-D1-1 [Lactuca sativa]